MDNKPRILIVEDEPNYREFLYRTLSNNYQIDLAQKGPEALDLLRLNTFEVILFDPRIPGRPGKRLVQGILDAVNKDTATGFSKSAPAAVSGRAVYCSLS